MIDFKQKIAEQISKTTNIPQEQIIEYIEIPADEKMGDFSFPCFATSFSKTLFVYYTPIKQITQSCIFY